jgi:hypothetical protein
MPRWTQADLDAYERRRKANENRPAVKVPDSEPAKQAAALDGDGERKAPVTGRPRVRFVLCRVRLLDVDAKYGSVKDLLDGLATAGLIPGDREDQVSIEVHQFKVRHYEDEETLIEIEL